MKVLMLRDKLASEDGVTTKLFATGETYDIGDTLGEGFIAEGLAETVTDIKPSRRKAE
ncbi:hypothetical protein ACSBOB_20150 [Mesorhizobium sp. ASY16-5R]|uniref:hypothetical protein n=1 Tax=Mesorhizobium sp. ASY16-5R TaxID=3445772 RepID=UPI003FA0D858